MAKTPEFYVGTPKESTAIVWVFMVLIFAGLGALAWIISRDDPDVLAGPRHIVVYVVDVSGSQQDISPEDKEALQASRRRRMLAEIERAQKDRGVVVLTTFSGPAQGGRDEELDFSDREVGCAGNECPSKTAANEKSQYQKFDRFLNAIGKVKTRGGTKVVSDGFEKPIGIAGAEAYDDTESRRLIVESDFQSTDCPERLRLPASRWPAPSKAANQLAQCLNREIRLDLFDSVTLVAIPYASGKVSSDDIEHAAQTFVLFCSLFNEKCRRGA